MHRLFIIEAEMEIIYHTVELSVFILKRKEPGIPDIRIRNSNYQHFSHSTDIFFIAVISHLSYLLLCFLFFHNSQSVFNVKVNIFE